MSDVLFGNEKLRKYENVNNITLYTKGIGMSQVQCFLGIQNTTFLIDDYVHVKYKSNFISPAYAYRLNKMHQIWVCNSHLKFYHSFILIF